MMTAESLATIDGADPGSQLERSFGTRLRRVAIALYHNKPALLAGLFLLALVTCAVFASTLAPASPNAQSVPDRLLPPAWSKGGSSEHILGTDALGRDVLSRIIHGSRVSLLVGAGGVLFAGLVGTSIGLLAGYRGGWIDRCVVAMIDLQLAFPGLLLALVVLTVVQPGIESVLLVLTVATWPVFARLTRGVTLAMKESPFINAAELVGCGPLRIMWRHILPNLVSPLVTLSVLQFAVYVLGEAGLSFLGLGVQPPTVSWGLDISVGRESIWTAWWLVTFPGVAIALTVVSLNLFASWLRLVVDPSEREKPPRRARRRDPGGGDVPQAGRHAGGGATSAGVGEPLLAVRDLRVEFPTSRGTVSALRGVSFEVRRGETMALVGESGSGKSVTAMAILGLIPEPGRITGGDVSWNGQSLVRGPGAKTWPGRCAGARSGSCSKTR